MPGYFCAIILACNLAVAKKLSPYQTNNVTTPAALADFIARQGRII
jgi:hypothetical protein